MAGPSTQLVPLSRAGQEHLLFGPNYWQVFMTRTIREIMGTHRNFRASEHANEVISILQFVGPDIEHVSRPGWQSVAGLQSWDIHSMERCLSVLEKFSMIQRDEDGKTYSMQSLVHPWSRNRLRIKRPEDFHRYSATVLMLLISATKRVGTTSLASSGL